MPKKTEGRYSACPLRAPLILREHEISVIAAPWILIEIRLGKRLGTHRRNLVGHHFFEVCLLLVHHLLKKRRRDAALLVFRGFHARRVTAIPVPPGVPAVLGAAFLCQVSNCGACFCASFQTARQNLSGVVIHLSLCTMSDSLLLCSAAYRCSEPASLPPSLLKMRMW